ncbi:oligosaccharide flippase family protein [Akkermansiaceae bacterium]|nr:oligosaccharide flippase family protein [Akkermansiaceae bacterium]
MFQCNSLSLRSLAQKLAGHSFWILVQKFLRQTTAIAATMALVRQFDAEQFGLYQLIVTCVALAGFFALPGMNMAVIQSVARGFDGTFRSANRWSFRSSFLGSAALLLCSGWHWFSGSSDAAIAFVVAAVLFPLSAGLTIWQSFYDGKQQFRQAALIMGGIFTMGNGLIVTGFFVGWNQIWIPVFFTYFVLAAVNSFMTLHTSKRVSESLSPESGLMAYGFRTSIYGLANIAANHLDRLLLFFLISPEVMAVFILGERFPELAKKNLQSLTRALVPEFSRKTRYTETLEKKIKLLGLVMALVIVFVAVAVVPWLLPILFTDAYSDSVLICQLLLFSLILGLQATVKFSYVQAHMDERGFRNVTLIMSFSRILFSLVLVPFFGAIGAALSSILYRVVTYSVVDYHLKKHHSHVEA